MPADAARLDQDHLWHPFLAHGRGLWVVPLDVRLVEEQDHHGKLGHNRRRIQVDRLPTC